MTVTFNEVDFQAVEGEGQINFRLQVMGRSSIDLGLEVTPYTFEEYRQQIGRRIPDVISDRAEGVDRAECEWPLSADKRLQLIMASITECW